MRSFLIIFCRTAGWDSHNHHAAQPRGRKAILPASHDRIVVPSRRNNQPRSYRPRAGRQRARCRSISRSCSGARPMTCTQSSRVETRRHPDLPAHQARAPDQSEDGKSGSTSICRGPYSPTLLRSSNRRLLLWCTNLVRICTSLPRANAAPCPHPTKGDIRPLE